MERNAAITLYTRPPELKAIVHFDSTGHSSIADVLIYQLKPLFFLYQDQEQISKLFVETLSWLATTLNVTYQNQNIQPSSLWEKIDALIQVQLQKTSLLKTQYQTG